MSSKKKSSGGVKEFFRKKIVALKRSPQIIPMLMLLATFVVYSFNLTAMSNTTAKIQGSNMGLCQFCIMLFSLLSMVCMLNAFPQRKKANIPMVVLMFVMFAIIFLCAINYMGSIQEAVTREVSRIVVDNSTRYIADANNMLINLMIMLGVTSALVVLLPVYRKLLKKINTSVEVEDNGSMDEIELND